MQNLRTLLSGCLNGKNVVKPKNMRKGRLRWSPRLIVMSWGQSLEEGELWVTCKGREKVIFWEHLRSSAARESKGPVPHGVFFSLLVAFGHIKCVQMQQNMCKNPSVCMCVHIYMCVCG